MTVIKKLDFVSTNKRIRPVLIDNSYVNVVLLDGNKVFKYYNKGKYYKIIVVQFKYLENIISQAFYECQGEYKGTWLPFDGIKGNVDEEGVFYKYMDQEAFDKELPFGGTKMMAVSYILGGGVWSQKELKYKEKLGVDERSSFTLYSDTVDVDFQDSLYINHYINYSISRNYYDSNPNEKLRPSSPQWIKDSKKLKNDQKVFSAFDFSTKMNNSYQIEYTPPVFPNYTNREDYQDFYRKIDKSKIHVNTQISTCDIL